MKESEAKNTKIKSEKAIELSMGRYIRSLGGLWYKFCSPMNAGVPDRIAILDGKVWFIEVKKIGGKLSPIQQIVHKEMSVTGVTVHVLNSVEQLKELIENETRKVGGK